MKYIILLIISIINLHAELICVWKVNGLSRWIERPDKVEVNKSEHYVEVQSNNNKTILLINLSSWYASNNTYYFVSTLGKTNIIIQTNGITFHIVKRHYGE